MEDNSPLLDELRSDPRFKKLLEQIEKTAPHIPIFNPKKPHVEGGYEFWSGRVYEYNVLMKALRGK